MNGWAWRLSVLRAGLAPVIAALLVTGQRRAAGLALAVAGVTDLVDGPLARRGGGGSDAGARLDVAADGAVVLAAWGALSWTGVARGWVPALLAAQLGWFAVSWRREGRVRYDPAGRYLGAVAMVGAMVLAFFPRPPLAAAIGTGLGVMAVASAAFRLGNARSSRPGAGR